MVRVTRRRSARFCLASSLGAALAIALGGCSSDASEKDDEPVPETVVHPRTSAGPEGRWTACVHDTGSVPDDIREAMGATPSLAACPREEPLPCGACNDEGELCSAGVTRGCCDRPYVSNAMMSPFDSWVCRCEGGAYNCWRAFLAASSCGECTVPPGACSESTGACADGCFSINAAYFDPEQECVSTIFERVGCTSIEETTSDSGCVRRVSDGALFVATSFTRHLQSDDWEACSAEEIAKTQVVCD
jgi:hypothetical protein